MTDVLPRQTGREYGVGKPHIFKTRLGWCSTHTRAGIQSTWVRLHVRDDLPTQSGIQAMRTIDFPDEWGTGAPTAQETFKSPDGKIVIASVLLDDGSGLWALIFEGGHRFARTSGYTGWAIEERFHGDPTPTEAAEVNQAWRDVLRAMIRAGHEVDAMLGRGK